MTETSAADLRFGAVPYLNARPLLEGLEDEVGPVRLEVPGVLADQLAAGEVDVALAPVVVGFQHPELVVVPAGAVVARGAVKSVLLFTHTPVEDIRTVGLDASSRTSAALVRVLFAHRWGRSPKFVSRPPDPDLSRLEQDAVLLIGDPALDARWDGPPPMDLGSLWFQWTGLPFVFATWLARDQAAATTAEPFLRRAAERGREALERIASEGAERLGLAPDETACYLRDHLSFEYREAERQGLDRFREFWHATPGLS